MGIKIELTDDEIIEPSGGIAMFDLPAENFRGTRMCCLICAGL